ncbi:PucR family transcriptional regulator [Paenarthrobacter sp. NPDC058040]|uniref:PucR family transcriptional regulator n=1 Tax=unclassified Paenarthrobacter TaxID=2634190 RepID=UPI0036D84C5E
MNRDKVQQFVDQLAEKLGRSVAVDDRNRHFVACSRHFGDLDRLRVDVLVSRRVEGKSSSYVYGFFDAENPGDPIRVPENDDLGITVRRCYPVRKDNEWVGFLWLIGEATEADDRVVSHSLPELALVLSQEPMNSAQSEAVVWTAFLEALSDPKRREEIRNFWTKEIIDPQANIAVLVAYDHHDPGGPRSMAKLLDGVLAQSIRGRRITRTASLVRGRVALTVIRDQDSRSPGQAGFPLGRLAQHGAERVSVGLSNWGPVTESVELLMQATLAAYSAFTRKEAYLSWPDCSYQGVLLRAALEGREQVIPKCVRKLADTTSGAPLIETLLVFLEEGGDVTKASARLNIHRTTLYYRLSRVEEVTGCDLKNGNDRLALHLGAGLLAFLDTEIPVFLHCEES